MSTTAHVQVWTNEDPFGRRSDTGVELVPIESTDMVSLFTVPLEVLPLTTSFLSTGKLIKNIQLKPVLEVFNSRQTGSGQFDIEALPKLLSWPTDTIHPDLDILRRIAPLKCYDVYTLRMAIRSQGIKITKENHESLVMGKVDQIELGRYMRRFVTPLLKYIYDDEKMSADSVDDLIAMFGGHDGRKARTRLRNLAEVLSIEPMQVPQFLEDFGDIFMALGYYRSSLERFSPYMASVQEATREIINHFRLSKNVPLVHTCRHVEHSIEIIKWGLSNQLDKFSYQAGTVWQTMTPEAFKCLRASAERHHSSIGGAISALGVKFNAFAIQFPTREAASPDTRADFIKTEILQGIKAVRQEIRASVQDAA